LEDESEKFKALIFLPNEVKANVYEGFDPVLVSGDVIDIHFAKALNLILDFNDSQPDAQFIEQIKDTIVNFIGEWIDEL
jgi:hypothetical protein